MSAVVSVVVPVFRDVEGLSRCLAGLARQEGGGPLQIVVVDNGENPGIEGLVEAHRRQGVAVCLAREGQPGSYAARNAGVERSDGSVLAFTDADCVPDPRWVARGRRAVEAAGGGALVGGPVETVSAAPRLTLWDRLQIATAFQPRRLTGEVGFLVTANLFVPRAAFDALGGFDASLRSGGDGDFVRRARERGFGIRFDEGVVVRHRSRSSLPELLAKNRRVAGGIRDRVASPRGRAIRLAKLLLPVKDVRNAWAYSFREGNLLGAVPLSLAAVGVKWYRGWCLVAFWVTGQPTPRS